MDHTTKRAPQRSGLGVAALAAATLLVGCGSDDQTDAAPTAAVEQGGYERDGRVPGSGSESAAAATTTTYVGALHGTDAYVSVTTDDDGAAVVYVCDGAALVEYLDGTVSDGVVEAAEPLGTTATATIDGGAAAGTVTLPDGTEHTFAADAAEGDAGAFWFEDLAADAGSGEAVVGGWIRLADGSVRGKVQTVTVSEGPTVADGGPPALGDGSASVPPEAEPTGIIADFRCGRNIRKMVQVAAAIKADPQNDGLHAEFNALVQRNTDLNCPYDPSIFLL